MGNPEWAQEELFKDRITRGENMDALMALSSRMVRAMEGAGPLSRGAEAPYPVRADQHDEQCFTRANIWPIASSSLTWISPASARFACPERRPNTVRRNGRCAGLRPRLGQHEEEVYCGELGLTPERLNQLRQAHVA